MESQSARFSGVSTQIWVWHSTTDLLQASFTSLLWFLGLFCWSFCPCSVVCPIFSLGIYLFLYFEAFSFQLPGAFWWCNQQEKRPLFSFHWPNEVRETPIKANKQTHLRVQYHQNTRHHLFLWSHPIRNFFWQPEFLLVSFMNPTRYKYFCAMEQWNFFIEPWSVGGFTMNWLLKIPCKRFQEGI